MTNKKQIYLLRHGEIIGSKKKRFIGQLDVPLSSKGLRQAAWWKKELSHVDFQRVYSSDLIRAFDTVKRVADIPDSHVHVMSQLREINLGSWEGEPMENIKSRFPDAWEERGRHMDSFQVPNGESFQGLHDRVIPVFQKIAAEALGNVLIVAHAGVNRIILCHVLKRPIRELFSIPQGYAALNMIEYERGKLDIKSMNIIASR
jgi:alpha-ribazole phosphatase